MVKVIYVKTENRLAFMDELRLGLEREKINIRGWFPGSGRLWTPHVKVVCLRYAFPNAVAGIRCDEAFYFDPEDHMDMRVKNPQNRYEGTPLGYIIKTEAEETIKEEHQLLKQAQLMTLNSVYGKLNCESLYPDSFVNYAKDDVLNTQNLYKIANGNSIQILPLSRQKLEPKIKNVIFNNPATIVFWSDGTKTVVKAQDDDWFDPEKGLAMAITKKALGNKGNYCNELKKWLPKEEESIFDDIPSLEELSDALQKVFKSLGE